MKFKPPGPSGITRVRAGARKAHHTGVTAAAAELELSAGELARISDDLEALQTPDLPAI